MPENPVLKSFKKILDDSPVQPHQKDYVIENMKGKIEAGEFKSGTDAFTYSLNRYRHSFGGRAASKQEEQVSADHELRADEKRLTVGDPEDHHGAEETDGKEPIKKIGVEEDPSDETKGPDDQPESKADIEDDGKDEEESKQDPEEDTKLEKAAKKKAAAKKTAAKKK